VDGVGIGVRNDGGAGEFKWMAEYITGHPIKVSNFRLTAMEWIKFNWIFRTTLWPSGFK
jgi:hypothetical protein